MRNVVCAIVAAAALVTVGMVTFAVLPARALSTDIPVSGLPSAAMYSATLLPETEGVVSWKTLAQVEAIRQGDKIVPQFSKDILQLDAKPVRVQGFILPLDLGDQQHHFLLSAVPPHCPFCLPAGPDAIVEVLAKNRVQYGFEPIVMSGKFAILKNDSSGVLYRLTDAEPIASARK